MTRLDVVDALMRWATPLGLVIERGLAGDIAIFSPDRVHRYVVTRGLGPHERLLVCIGANPSTADAFRNDPTVKRIMGFGSAWGCGLYVMLNAYGFRATEPAVMWAAAMEGVDIVGEFNDAVLELMLMLTAPGDVALAAWGAITQPDRAKAIAALARQRGIALQCLGETAGGAPRHPLYIGAAVQPRPWAHR